MKTVRMVFAVLSGGLMPVLSALTPEPSIDLPEVLAKVQGQEVTREAGLKVLRHRVDIAAIPGGEFRSTLKKVLIEAFCTQLLRRELRDAGFEPSTEMVIRSIAEAESHLPPGWPKTPEAEKKLLAGNPDVQLKVAVRLYLRKTMPEKFKITDAEIEDYYRANQRQFLIPARFDCDELAVKPTEAGRQSLLDARARLRQNESVESVRASLREPLARRLSPEFQMRIVGALPDGVWSEIIEQPYGLFLIRVNERVPAAYIPLDDVYLFIRQELESKRAALELEKILSAKLSQLDIEIYF